MKKAIVVCAMTLITSVGISAVVSAATNSTPQTMSCVKYGPKGGTNANGNNMLYNWNKSKCPSGTYAVNWNTQGTPGQNGTNGTNGTNSILSVKKTDLGGNANVVTGGSFLANSTSVGTISIPAGTFQISVNAKATPNQPSNDVSIYPQFFVYDQAKNADFTGDVLNVGSGALENGANANIDSYYSGSTIITESAPVTLNVYAFGYDSDRGSSNYNLDDLSVSIVQMNSL